MTDGVTQNHTNRLFKANCDLLYRNALVSLFYAAQMQAELIRDMCPSQCCCSTLLQ